jgi:hypothetical protein
MREIGKGGHETSGLLGAIGVGQQDAACRANPAGFVCARTSVTPFSRFRHKTSP